MPDPNARPSAQIALRRFLREPLLHFLTLAGVLFLVQVLFGADALEEIVIDAATQEFLLAREEDLFMRPATEEERQALIENFVEEEILVREANRRGFADSSRVRALLIQNMRFFITGDIPEPTDEELRAFFEAEKDSFVSPPSFDLEQVYVPDPADLPHDVLDQLTAGADPQGFGVFDLGYPPLMRFMDAGRLVQAFGREGAEAVLEISPDDTGWHGPLIAPQGSAHFVRITARNAPRAPEFETARDWVATQWYSAQARSKMDEEIADMAENYRIVVEPLGDGAADG